VHAAGQVERNKANEGKALWHFVPPKSVSVRIVERKYFVIPSGIIAMRENAAIIS
jgi:hypothetical protein